jgi:curli biogenesis system outer membrane secretion channel CsgG
MCCQYHQNGNLNNMRLRLIAVVATSIIATGCVTTPVAIDNVDAPVSLEQQLAAQAENQTINLALKRKVAVGRLSNETTYGKSLLSATPTDKIADKVSDMFVQGLVNSNNYLVFERPDVEALQSENALSGIEQEIIGVDTLIIGSLTEFGRVTSGEAGFISSSKKQEATATIDLRLVDVKTGQVIHTITGTGVATTETKNTMGFGSVAGYDGSINDRAIGAAVNAAIGKLDSYMLEKKWSADALAYEDDVLYISGGASQGIKAGMTFSVFTKGKQVKSTKTGTTITLPGENIATIEILSTFGDTELEEGSAARVISGSLQGVSLESIEVKESN